MCCFPCFRFSKKKEGETSSGVGRGGDSTNDAPNVPQPAPVAATTSTEEQEVREDLGPAVQKEEDRMNDATENLRKRETESKVQDDLVLLPPLFDIATLMDATENFRPGCFLGEGSLGRLYRGRLKDGQVVTVKLLDPFSFQGKEEFVREVHKLSKLSHPNLVNLIGYCADYAKILVHEFMTVGSLQDHLHGLDWKTRMKIAAGAAKGMEYLHKADPPIIFGEFRPSNILLTEGYDPKLSEFGLSKHSPAVNSFGYQAPEYAMTGKLSVKSDVYSFGVVLLQLITGRRAINYDSTRTEEQNLVAWARPLLKDKSKKFTVSDWSLQSQYSLVELEHALNIVEACLQEEEKDRPTIGSVAVSLSLLNSQPSDLNQAAAQSSRASPSTQGDIEDIKNITDDWELV